MGYGINAILGIAFQNSYGTAAGVSSAAWLEFNSENINVKKPPLISQGMSGKFDEAPTYEGPNVVEGEFSIDAKPLDIGWLLKAAIGAPTTVNSSGIYTHTFKPRTSDFDEKCAMNPFTLFKYLGVSSGDSFPDLNATTLELSIANGEFLQAKLGVIGGQYAQAVVPAGSYYPGNRMAWDVASLSIGGSAVDYSSELTIALDNKLEAKHTLRTSKYPAYIKRSGFRTINVSGTLRFDSQTEKQAFLDQSERNLTICFKGSTEIQSGYYETLTIVTPAFRYMEFPDAAGGPTDIEVSFQAAAKYLTSSATALHITLVNTRATY